MKIGVLKIVEKRLGSGRYVVTGMSMNRAASTVSSLDDEHCDVVSPEELKRLTDTPDRNWDRYLVHLVLLQYAINTWGGRLVAPLPEAVNDNRPDRDERVLTCYIFELD